MCIVPEVGNNWRDTVNYQNNIESIPQCNLLISNYIPKRKIITKNLQLILFTINVHSS